MPWPHEPTTQAWQLNTTPQSVVAATNVPRAGQPEKQTRAGKSASLRQIRWKLWGPLAGGAVLFVGLLVYLLRHETPSGVGLAAADPMTTFPQAKPISGGTLDLADVVERLNKGIVLLNLTDAAGKSLGLGTGFIVSPSGQVVTNHHVIAGSAKGSARFGDGTVVAIKEIVAADAERDLAIVQLERLPKGCSVLTLRPEVALRQGSRVIAIGHPRGLDYSVSEGIISALRTTSELPDEAREFLESPEDQTWIQTTAAISGGNSGGPLLLPDGGVVGINTWTAGGENLGFASHIKHVVELRKSVGSQPAISLEVYNKANGGLETASMHPADRFAAQFESQLSDAEEVDWRPNSDENRERIYYAAGSLALARARGLSPTKIEAFSASAAQREWDYHGHVRPLNDLTAEWLKNRRDSAMFFGKIISADGGTTRRLTVKLVGRGYDLDVLIPPTVTTPWVIGDQVMVAGMRVDAPSQRLVHTILAGVFVRTKWTDPPASVALLECRDYLDYSRKFDQFQARLIDYETQLRSVTFPVDIRGDLTRLYLNRDEHGFAAFRIPASRRAADDDLAWFFITTPKAIEKWGITSLDGQVSPSFDEHSMALQFKIDGFEKSPGEALYYQHLDGNALKNSKEHVIWFRMTDEAAAREVQVVVAGVYVPHGTLLRSTSSAEDALNLVVFESIGGVTSPDTMPATNRSFPIRPAFVPSPHQAGKIVLSKPEDEFPRADKILKIEYRPTPEEVTCKYLGGPEIVISPDGPYRQPSSLDRRQAMDDVRWLFEQRIDFVGIAPPSDGRVGGETRARLYTPSTSAQTPVPREYVRPTALIVGQALTEEQLHRIRTISTLRAVVAEIYRPKHEHLYGGLGALPGLDTFAIGRAPPGAEFYRAMAKSTSLETLYLGTMSADVDAVRALSSIASLRQLILRQARLDDLTAMHLAKLVALEKLDCSEMLFARRTFQILAPLKRLRSLRLLKMILPDGGLESLQTLTALRELTLDGTALGPRDVAALSTLRALNELSVVGCGLTAAQVSQLQAALPDCRVRVEVE